MSCCWLPGDIVLALAAYRFSRPRDHRRRSGSAMGAWRGTYATESRQQTEHFSSDLAGCAGHARAGGVACADSVDGREVRLVVATTLASAFHYVYFWVLRSSDAAA